LLLKLYPGVMPFTLRLLKAMFYGFVEEVWKLLDNSRSVIIQVHEVRRKVKVFCVNILRIEFVDPVKH
jgi:hypothetical protein